MTDRKPVESRSKIWFKIHCVTFVCVIALLFLIDWWLASEGWLFWVCCGWSVVLAIHFFIVKSMHVDEDWADDRALELRINSYDLKHIHAVRSRYIKKRPKA